MRSLRVVDGPAVRRVVVEEIGGSVTTTMDPDPAAAA
jgi:hypothetical protein